MSDTVIVAALASLPATITAGAAWIAAARGRRDAAVAAVAAATAASAAADGRDVTTSLEARFKGNGHGDVVHMLETLLERADLHDLRHAADDGAFNELAALVVRPKRSAK